ncbi:MAG TPA: NAD(P)H-hydrate dehydratase [Candidatus Limiplasma sp.]|nr:NAD(P)H-hydrate dehydratase [Candidatus Limiplasma sp.]
MLHTILPEEMKRVERRVMDATGIPSLTLMERAAVHVADAASFYLRNGGRLILLCGTGNNGGDGLAATRMLLERMPRLQAEVWFAPGVKTAEAAAQQARLKAYAARITTVQLEQGVPEIPADCACVMDALFGTGLSRPLEGPVRAAVEKVNVSGAPVVAVDIPSGLNGQTGYPAGEDPRAPVIRAEVTVTFHRPKTGLFLGEGLNCCGRVVVGEIGIPAEWDDAAGPAVLNRGDRLLPPRLRNTHKGTYGKVLALVGSFGMAGAAGICATAALRAGAGLVTVACPERVTPTVQALCPCATCIPLSEEDPEAAWAAFEKQLAKADAVIAGCGMGQGRFATAMLDRLIPWLCINPMPAVLDADALQWLAQSKDIEPDQLTENLAQPCDCPRLPDEVALTPHLGEAARLLRCPVAEVQKDQLAAARALRKRYGGSVVLKSASAALVGADGEAINLYGTAAMAKGGSGDALAGVLGALMAGRVAYGLHGVRLLQTACALHGLAGMAAAEAWGERGLLATDLCEALGRVPDLIERSIATEAPHAQRLNAYYDSETISMHDVSEEVANLSHGHETQPLSVPEARTAGLRAALGKKVRVTVDRPFGSRHPEHRDIVYGLNYGYVADVLAADNEWQDAYILGVTEPVEVFEGYVVAVIHRLNDVEDKWVVAAPDTPVTEADVRERTAFVEKFFTSEILLP